MHLAIFGRPNPRLFPALFTLACFSFLLPASAGAIPWPGGTENSIPISDASSDLSGASWNPVSQSLWAVRQNRQVWEYRYDSDTGDFELWQTLFLSSQIGTDIEGCTQVDHSTFDELYTLDEDNGRVSRVINIDTSPTVHRVWNLLVLNNGHALPPESGGSGPEGLEFVPDAHLIDAGFRFPDGGAFSGSTKGMGGLIFIGHQTAGRLHVFDINPSVSEDFINHGSFLTSANETAGLHFDRTSGLMYLWHNPSNVNSLEVSTLSSDGTLGKIDTLEIYSGSASMPAGNLEGMALVDRSSCGEFGAADTERFLFLTRDGSSPNLLYFDGFPCDCSGPISEAEFDICAASGDLSGGCVCLDQDLDGDVDCDDFDPAISAQCGPVPVPTVSRSGLVILGISVMLASAFFLHWNARRKIS
jgi:hypothetical protein